MLSVLALLAAVGAVDVSISGGCVEAAELERELRARVDPRTALRVEVATSGEALRQLAVVATWTRDGAAPSGALSRTLAVAEGECVDAALLVAAVVIAAADPSPSAAPVEAVEATDPIVPPAAPPAPTPLPSSPAVEAAAEVSAPRGLVEEMPDEPWRSALSAGARVTAMGPPLSLKAALLGGGALDLGDVARLHGSAGIEAAPVSFNARSALLVGGVLGVGLGLPLGAGGFEPLLRVEGGPVVVMGISGVSGVTVVPTAAFAVAVRLAPSEDLVLEPALWLRALRVGIRAGDDVFAEPLLGASMTVAVGGSR